MIERLRAGFRHTALGPAVVIWGFGYVLVDIVAVLLGRSAPGLTLLASLPMFALGVGQTIALDRLRKGLRRRPLPVRWPLLTIAILAATVVQTLFDVYWMRWMSLAILPQWQDWAVQINLPRLLTVGVVYLWTFCLALTLLWATRSSVAVEKSGRRAASAEAAAAQAEAAALRLQLNPHFLFNALNSISSLVVLGHKEQAEEMIGRLCEFLRASLNADPMADVSLAQEIDAIDAYLGIEAERFGDRLEIDIDVEPGVNEAQVPNFILQPLVENAIKHGVAMVRGRASLRVAAAQEGSMLLLSVINSATDGQTEHSPPDEAIHPARPSTGIGLPNIRQRLANRYGERARLETGATPGGYRAIIRLPVVKRPKEEE